MECRRINAAVPSASVRDGTGAAEPDATQAAGPDVTRELVAIQAAVPGVILAAELDAIQALAGVPDATPVRDAIPADMPGGTASRGSGSAALPGRAGSRHALRR
jgi:hypothetical protein